MRASLAARERARVNAWVCVELGVRVLESVFVCVLRVRLLACVCVVGIDVEVRCARIRCAECIVALQVQSVHDA